MIGESRWLRNGAGRSPGQETAQLLCELHGLSQSRCIECEFDAESGHDTVGKNGRFRSERLRIRRVETTTRSV
jgi:hypothetical protein